MVSITAIHLLPCLECVLLLFCSHCVPQFGTTALMEASGSGCTDSVHVLLSAGAQVDLQNKVRHSIYISNVCVRIDRGLALLEPLQ